MSEGSISGQTEAVLVSGPDAADFLQGLISQDVTRANDSSAIRSFLLGPRGKFRALIWLARQESDFWLFTDSPGNVIEDLTRFKIRVDCTITHHDATLHDVLGNHPAAGWAVEIPWGGTTPRWIVVGAENLDGPSLSMEEWTLARIEAGEPLMDRDVDEGTIPQESGLVSQAVAFDKGCYLGQELVARIDSRGRVNRRLVRLIAQGALPEGSSIVAGEETVGVVTSSAADNGRSKALAIIPASWSEDVTVNGVVAHIEELA